ncbi:hypothetical protein ACIQUC_09885 [Curtobacterium sp. NPDC098951]|uniref:hypothetical protein n=1 Tax=Curtobacterium sp. NPDC098951 TaxID=3363974 RepID=UPI0037F3497D
MTAFVGLTAIAGGIGMVTSSGMSPTAPPPSWADASSLSVAFVPGLLLSIVVGGAQFVAFVAAVTSARRGAWATVSAALTLLAWCLVQAALIGGDLRQALYVVFGLVELGIAGAAFRPSVQRAGH